jgi:hypothetical protein
MPVQSAPSGNRRASWKHGLYSAEALAEQKRVHELLSQNRERLKQMQPAEQMASRCMGFIRGFAPGAGLGTPSPLVKEFLESAGSQSSARSWSVIATFQQQSDFQHVSKTRTMGV